jgi:hypothetical protein
MGTFPDLLFLQLLLLLTVFVGASLRKPMASVQPDKTYTKFRYSEHEVHINKHIFGNTSSSGSGSSEVWHSNFFVVASKVSKLLK